MQFDNMHVLTLEQAFPKVLLAFPRRLESTPQGTIGFLWGKFKTFLGNFWHSSR